MLRINTHRLELAVAATEQTYKQLAVAAGISAATLSYINNGKPCKPLIAGKLARALGIPLEQLIETKEAQP